MPLLTKIAGWLTRGAPARAVEKAARSFGPNDMWIRGSTGDVFDTTLDRNANEKCAIVYACVEKTSRDVSRCPLLVLRDPNDPESVVENDPLVALLNRPHPALTQSEFIEFIVKMLRMRGEVFIVPDNIRQTTLLIPFYDPLGWQEQVDNAGMLTGWRYQGGSQTFSMMRDAVVHYRHLNLSNPYRGLSPLKAAAASYYIDVYGDTLKRTKFQKGGEGPAVFETPESVTLEPDQYEQLIARLGARKASSGETGRDLILDGGMRIVDPKMTATDLQIIENQNLAAERICQVFGLSLALLGQDSAANYVDTFKRREAIYWKQTLLPIMHGLEQALTSFFQGSYRSKYVVRFDTSGVEALQQELGVQLDNAAKLKQLGVPLTVVNDRLQLGLDTGQIPGSDEVFVPVGMAPLSVVVDAWTSPLEDEGKSADIGAAGTEPAQEKAVSTPPPPASRPVLTRAEIRRRATDPRTTILRTRRMIALERRASSAWRLAVGDLKKAAVKIVKDMTMPGLTPQNILSALPDALKGLRDEAREKLPQKMEPYHVAAVAEGVLSIQQTVARVSLDDGDLWLKAPTLSAAAEEVVRKRANRVVNMADDIFNTIREAVAQAIPQGIQAGEITQVVSNVFNSSINRAVTIGRTEVGTAYNSSRFVEMEEQGYKAHEWITAGDERVREEDPFNHAACDGEVRSCGDKFPCGLAYPMEDGGDPGNVINCRCLTIPAGE